MKPESLLPLGLKGSRLLRFLAGEIAAGRVRPGEPKTFVTYANALRGVGISEIHHAGQQLRQEGLAELNGWTMIDAGLPKIAALIVNQNSHRPSAPFFTSHDREPDDLRWWMEQANAAIGYDWSPYLAEARTEDEPTARDREDSDELPDYRGVVTREPAPAHIRKTKVSIGEILRRLATGQSEAEIVRACPGLRRADIRAGLAYAADREQETAASVPGQSRLSTLASRWQGSLTLPKSDPDDPRMDYLLKRYWRHQVGRVQPASQETTPEQHGEEQWVAVERYVTGKVIAMDGTRTPNVQVLLEGTGDTLTISGSKAQLAGKAFLDQTVTLRIAAEEHLETKDVRNARLIELLPLRQEVDEEALARLWKKGRAVWQHVGSANAWVEEARGN